MILAQRAHVPFGSPFSLMAKVRSYRRPEFYLKVEHNCQQTNSGQNMTSILPIPSQYVTRVVKNKFLGKGYYLKNLNLFVLKGSRLRMHMSGR
uniref:Uncharacterized protein n=1 Tax=Strongyloides papillosus TaxID=174720 RepID=A0A0N5BQR5_STREA